MTLQPSLIFTVLQHVSIDRLQKPVTALVEGSLTMTLQRHTETEVRALMRNGVGKDYGVTLPEAKAFCSCPDALYRGTVCKHATTLVLAVLRGEVKGTKSTRTIHLGSQD